MSLQEFWKVEHVQLFLAQYHSIFGVCSACSAFHRVNPIKYAYVYIYISIYIHRYTYSQRYIKYTLVYSSNLLAYLFHVHLRHSFKTAIFSRFLKVAIATSSFMNKFYNDVAIVTFKNLLKMAVLKECLNKMDMEKVG